MTTAAVPALLRSGDAVAIVSPASVIDPLLVEGAANALMRHGFKVKIGAHALGRCGTYSGSVAERLSDMVGALRDPEVRAVLCSRGGYGCVHLLSALVREVTPKWLVGFSDVSALHALWHRCGVCSVHASMAKHLALFPPDDPANVALLRLLTTGIMPDVEWAGSKWDRHGAVSGTLLGGNLAVLDGLAGTEFDLLRADAVLFIEDIAEPVYKVERILYRLKLSGALARLRGLVVGQFTDYRPDANHESMEAMIAAMVSDYDYPVAMNAPVGHVDDNRPLLEGGRVRLEVTGAGARLSHN